MAEITTEDRGPFWPRWTSPDGIVYWDADGLSEVRWLMQRKLEDDLDRLFEGLTDGPD